MRTIQKAYRYRITPTREQQRLLALQFGYARFVYNHYRALREQTYQDTARGLSYADCTDDLPRLKKTYPWLRDADSQVLQQSLKNLDRAYESFFAGRTKYPTFKRKHDPQAIRYPQRFKLVGNALYLPKVGWVAVRLHRSLEGTSKNCTVSKTKTGKYYVSIQCVVAIPEVDPLPDRIGIDLGLKDFAVLSTGEKIAPPKLLRQAERRLKIRQRRVSRKTKGSKSRARARIIVARGHERVANRRRDFQHQLSRQIANRFGAVVFEDLHVTGMLKNHSLAKSIADAGWSQFVQFVSYKLAWAGGAVAKADRFFASTKICSVCGERDQTLTLKDRSWVCSNCQTTHDRDLNAAINLNQLPLEWGKVTPVERRLPSGNRPRKPNRETVG
jgi:putative transposase